MTTTEPVVNQSGLKAVGRAVLCEPYDPEVSSSIIEIPDHIRQMQLMAEMRARVIQIGAACWPDEPPRAAPGDRVLISKFCGAIVRGTADGKLYRLCNDQDIFCQIESGEMDNMIIKNPVVKSKEITRESERVARVR